MTTDGGTCCACREVRYDPIKNDDGTCTERWRCTASGCEFVRAGAMTDDPRDRVIAALREEREAWLATLSDEECGILEAEKARDMHARINEAVAKGLRQDFGETWHDLGEKVERLREELDFKNRLLAAQEKSLVQLERTIGALQQGRDDEETV